MKKEIYSCDVCKTECKVQNQQLQVIFTTEQTEGRSIKPYLCMSKLDICNDCLDKVISGKAIFAHGAQGYNTFYFGT
jgi:hypothetical protein